MFKLFSELLLQGEIKMEEGSVSMLGQRLVMFPADVLVVMTRDFMNDPSRVKSMYELMRNTVRQGFVKHIKNKYKLEGRALVDWVIKIGELAGLGKYEIVDYDPAIGRAIVRGYNLPVATSIKGTTNKPVDHIIRGFMAGIASGAYDTDFDYVETKCVAKGDAYCEFIAKRRVDFRQEVTPLISDQIPV